MQISTATTNDSVLGANGREIGRIFLVGCPRSGTTLVQSVLAAHRDVVTFKESHFFDKGFRPRAWGGYRLVPDRVTMLSNFLDENQIGTPTERACWLEKFSLLTEVPAAASWLLRFLDRLAEEAGRPVWLEKTPDHVWRIPLLESIAPNARFVHVVRQPLPTIASLKQATGSWGKQRSWLHCLAHWRVSLAFSARYCGSKNHYFVFYDDFVSSPASETEQLLAWLDLKPDEELLARRRAEARGIVGVGESWKEKTFTEIAPRSSTARINAPWPIRAYVTYARLYEQLYRQVTRQRLPG